MKVAFANEVGRTCLALGISAAKVHEIFVADTKLNISPHYMRPGGAFGGSCLPKDVRALQHIGADAGANLHLVDSLLRSNEAHKHRLFEYASEGLAPGARILLAGLAFKADTDDLRENPNVDLARKLLAAGYDLEISRSRHRRRQARGCQSGLRLQPSAGAGDAAGRPGARRGGPLARVIAANATSRHLPLPFAPSCATSGCWAANSGQPRPGPPLAGPQNPDHRREPAGPVRPPGLARSRRRCARRLPRSR